MSVCITDTHTCTHTQPEWFVVSHAVVPAGNAVRSSTQQSAFLQSWNPRAMDRMCLALGLALMRMWSNTFVVMAFSRVLIITSLLRCSESNLKSRVESRTCLNQRINLDVVLNCWNLSKRKNFKREKGQRALTPFKRMGILTFGFLLYIELSPLLPWGNGNCYNWG